MNITVNEKDKFDSSKSKKKDISLHSIHKKLVESTGDISWVVDNVLSFKNEFYVFRNREGMLCVYYVRENRFDKCY